MMRFAFDGSGMFASTSAKYGKRSPVSTLMITIGASAASEALGSFQLGKFADDTPVSNCTSSGPLGEYPSQCAKSFGATGVLSTLVGMPSGGSASRNPVAVEES